MPLGHAYALEKLETAAALGLGGGELRNDGSAAGFEDAVVGEVELGKRVVRAECGRERAERERGKVSPAADDPGRSDAAELVPREVELLQSAVRHERLRDRLLCARVSCPYDADSKIKYVPGVPFRFLAFFLLLSRTRPKEDALKTRSEASRAHEAPALRGHVAHHVARELEHEQRRVAAETLGQRNSLGERERESAPI